MSTHWLVAATAAAMSVASVATSVSAQAPALSRARRSRPDRAPPHAWVQRASACRISEADVADRCVGFDSHEG